MHMPQVGSSKLLAPGGHDCIVRHESAQRARRAAQLPPERHVSRGGEHGGLQRILLRLRLLLISADCARESVCVGPQPKSLQQVIRATTRSCCLSSECLSSECLSIQIVWV